MSPKAIVIFALLAVAFAERPYLGFRIPLDMTQVVGGSDAPQGAYPFIVSLQWGASAGSLQHFCAGSIYNNNWIITAAHCVDAVPSNGKLYVWAGKYDIKKTEANEQLVEVDKMYMHEKYGGGVGPYDIGLLKLKVPLKFSSTVQKINLPPAGDDPVGQVILCGWGTTSSTSRPNILQHVQLPYVDRETCSDAVRQLTGSSPVHETNVCTGPLTGGYSACSGDSGGPLFKKNSNGDYVLDGIVSWGIIPCGTRGAPSVYARVSVLIDWIAQNTKNL